MARESIGGAAVELEIDGEHNECLGFRPLPGRSIRGRFDMNRISEPMARIKATEWPTPIPSQRIGIDDDGNGFIVEPLHDAEYAPLREKILKTGQTLEPALTTIENIHAPSWLFWLRRAVESGIAHVVRGKLPDKIDGKPRMNFITNERGPSSSDKLTAAIERQSALMERLLERLAK